MKSSSRLKIIVIIVLLAIFFVIANLTGFQKPIKGFFYSCSRPILEFFWGAGQNIGSFFASPFEIKNLKTENENLRLSNKALLAQIASLENLKEENNLLREALNINLEKDFQLSLAGIIAKDFSRDSLLINKGGKDGVVKGAGVITQQKIIVGRIGQVFDDFAEVILLSSKDSTLDVKITGKDVYGLVKGKGKSEFYLDFVPKNKEISPGDMVVTTVLGGNLPSGLLVGQIESVSQTDTDPWQTAKINAGFDLNDASELFIIMPSSF